MLLFEETSLANLTIKNKIFRAATSETAANENGDITENLIDFYRKLARGGTGLIFTGHMYIEKEGQYAPIKSALQSITI